MIESWQYYVVNECGFSVFTLELSVAMRLFIINGVFSLSMV